jgi:hypothetical protein
MFTTNIRLNSLQRQINALEAVEGVTNPMVADVDASNHKITNLSSIGLKDGATNRTITLADSTIKIDGATYGGVSNPLTSDLDCNSKNLTSVEQITTGSVKFNDNSVLAPYAGNLEYAGNPVIVQGSAGFWLGSYDMGGNTISDAVINGPSADFGKITINGEPDQFTLAVDSTSKNLSLYTGSVVQPSDFVGEVAYISADNGLTTDIVTFTDTADSANHKLMLSSSTPYRLQIDGKQIMIEDDMTNYYSKDADINTQHDIYMNGHNIANIGELGIGLSQNKVLTLDGDDDLTFDENKIVTSANIAGYIDGSNIFQQVYKDSYLTDFNPSYTTYEMHIDLTPELAGQTPTLGYSVFIRGHLNAIVLARLPSGSDTVIGNECFDYELLVFGTGRSWSFNVDSVTAHNPYVHTDGTQHELTFTADPDNDNSIICTLNFEGINQNKIMNSYSVVVNRF